MEPDRDDADGADEQKKITQWRNPHESGPTKTYSVLWKRTENFYERPFNYAGVGISQGADAPDDLSGNSRPLYHAQSQGPSR
jgi:hypothetical protein